MILILKSPIYNGKKREDIVVFYHVLRLCCVKSAIVYFIEKTQIKMINLRWENKDIFLFFLRGGGAISSISGEHFSFVKKLPFFL